MLSTAVLSLRGFGQRTRTGGSPSWPPLVGAFRATKPPPVFLQELAETLIEACASLTIKRSQCVSMCWVGGLVSLVIFA